jgi:hypothetical protein
MRRSACFAQGNSAASTLNAEIGFVFSGGGRLNARSLLQTRPKKESGTSQLTRSEIAL